MILEYDIVTQGKIVKLENGTIINRYSHIVKGAEVGKNCMIAEHCYIAGRSKIGNNVRIQNYVSVWDGVEIRDDVFVGPRVTFTNHNDPHDRHKDGVSDYPHKTIIHKGVTLCAACIIVAPREIGEYVRIGAGSVVLKDIAAFEKRNGLIKK